MERTMKIFGVILLTVVLLGLGAAPTMAQSSAKEQAPGTQAATETGQSAGGSASSTETKPSSSGPYSGDIWHRSTLTGDWWGLRNQLAEKGITFDMSVTQVYQGIVSGGKDETWRYGGRGNTTINVDTQKLGLWPGGFFTLEMEGNWANSVNEVTGALMSVNTNQIFPLPTGDHFNLPNVSFMQFFSHYVGVVFGKLDTTSGDRNEFAYGKGDTQFMNTALSFNPVALLVVPYSTLGAGVIVLPTKDPKAAYISFNVLQTNGKPNTVGFDDLHSNQLTFTGEARVRTDFFGLTGHHLIGGGYSNKTFTSLDQSLRFFIETRTIEEKKGSWMIYYNFDQYLYEPHKGSKQGIGLFGRFGASDGNPNPIRYFFSLGAGGKGIIPGRPIDRFGIGFYAIDVSNSKFTGLLGRTTEFLRDEYGFEIFYNVAITPWLQVTPDIQVVKPAQKQTIRGENISTATVLGFRFQLVF